MEALVPGTVMTTLNVQMGQMKIKMTVSIKYSALLNQMVKKELFNKLKYYNVNKQIYKYEYSNYVESDKFRLKVLWAVTYTTAMQPYLFHFVLYKSIAASWT